MRHSMGGRIGQNHVHTRSVQRRVQQRLMRVQTLSLLFLLLSGLLPPHGHAERVPPIEQMKHSTVFVWCIPPGKSYVGTGSGFVTGQGSHIVTNWHVVSCTADGGEAVVRLGEQTIAALVVRSSQRKDIAILELEQALDKPSVSLATTDQVTEGQTVYALGFPGAARARSEEATVSVTKGIVSAKVTSQQGVQQYQTDAAISPGNSGGPLFNEDGHVIGINTATAVGEAVEGIGWAVQIEELIPELQKVDVSYHIAQGQSASPLSGLWSATPVWLALGLLVLGLGLVLFRRRNQAAAGKRSHPKASKEASRAKRSAHRPKPEESAPESLEPFLSRPSSALTASTPTLQGIQGYFSGSVLELSDEPITMGRDPRACQLVFPADMTDIGRRHCILRFAAHDHAFILEDCGSKNGTFLQSGQRLDAHQPHRLRSGERFHLSNPSTTFEVCFKED